MAIEQENSATKFENKFAKNIEDFFVASLAKEMIRRKRFEFCFSKPLLDDSGYDLVLDSIDSIKLIQIKTMHSKGKAGNWEINKKFLSRQEAVIVVVIYDRSSFEITHYLCWAPNEKIKKELKAAKKPKTKRTRPRLVELPKSSFRQIKSIEDLVTYILHGTTVDEPAE